MTNPYTASAGYNDVQPNKRPRSSMSPTMLQDAIDAPRLSVTSTSSSITMEPGFPQSTIDSLRTLGYTVGITTPGGEIGSVQAVLVEPQTGKQYGAADSRREGTVIGLPRSRSQ